MRRPIKSGKDRYAALLLVAMLFAYFAALIASWPGLQVLIKRILGV